MKRTYNKETGKTTWSIDTWHTKTAIVFGYAIMVLYLTAFIVGFIMGLL